MQQTVQDCPAFHSAGETQQCNRGYTHGLHENVFNAWTRVFNYTLYLCTAECWICLRHENWNVSWASWNTPRCRSRKPHLAFPRRKKINQLIWTTPWGSMYAHAERITSEIAKDVNALHYTISLIQLLIHFHKVVTWWWQAMHRP